MARSSSTPESKVCASCGREMEWRKKWAKNWDSIRYCSDECRKQKLDRKTDDLEAIILQTLRLRAAGLTMCPSEALPENLKQDHDAMEEVRRVARRLANEGKIEITQKGRVVDPSAFRGPIRLRLLNPKP